MSYFEEDTRKKSAPLFIGIFLVLLSAISATFAANISINGSNKIEFGQGVYVVEACNGWIQISLSYGETNGDGDSFITSFVINGLDTRACTSTNITFKAFGVSEDPTAGQLDIYNTFAAEEINEQAPIPVNLFTLRIDDQEYVSLVDSEGTTIADDDPFISLDADDATKTYIVGFTNPLATVAQLARITVESGPNA
jgi:hypothetical protein